MSLLLDALGSLGLGGQVMTAATLGVVAIYLVKGAKAGKTVGAVLTSGVGYAVAVLGAAALAIALGWVDPSVSTLMNHVQTAGEFVWDLSGGWVMDLIQGVLP